MNRENYSIGAKAGIILVIVFISILNTNYSLLKMPENKYTMLCLGDSYTIGQSLSEDERFPNQTVKLLDKEGINFEAPLINIAATTKMCIAKNSKSCCIQL